MTSSTPETDPADTAVISLTPPAAVPAPREAADPPVVAGVEDPAVKDPAVEAPAVEAPAVGRDPAPESRIPLVGRTLGLPPRRLLLVVGAAVAVVAVVVVVLVLALRSDTSPSAAFAPGEAQRSAVVETPAGPTAPPPVAQEQSTNTGPAKPGTPAAALASFEESLTKAVADGRVGPAAEEKIDPKLSALRAAVKRNSGVANAASAVGKEIEKLKVGKDIDRPTRTELLTLLAGFTAKK